MSRVCEMCGKGPTTGNLVSHSHRRTKRRWLPNLQKFQAMDVNGEIRTYKLCTRCARTMRKDNGAR